MQYNSILETERISWNPSFSARLQLLDGTVQTAVELLLISYGGQSILGDNRMSSARFSVSSSFVGHLSAHNFIFPRNKTITESKNKTMLCHSPTSTRIHFMHHPAAGMRRDQFCGVNRMQGASCCRSSIAGRCEPYFGLQAAFAATALLSFLIHISFVYFLFSLLSFRFVAFLFVTRMLLSTVHYLAVGNKTYTMKCCKNRRSSKKQQEGAQEQQDPKSEGKDTTKEADTKPEARKACCSPTAPRSVQHQACHPAAAALRSTQFANKMQRYAAAREAFVRRQQHAYATRTTGRQQLHVNEHASRVELSIDVPGVKANALNLSIDNGVLAITGSRATSANNTNSVFSRKFALDTTAIDATNLSANLIDGVLTVTAPKILVKPSSAAPIEVTITTDETEDAQSTPTETPVAAASTPLAGPASVEQSTTTIEEDRTPSTSTETTTITTEHHPEEPEVLDALNQGKNDNIQDDVERADSDGDSNNDDDDDDYVLMVETPDDESDVELEDETVLNA
jgi:HSP20 family molecular chaperone IbpA